MKKAIFSALAIISTLLLSLNIYAVNNEATTEATTNEQQVIQLTDYRYRTYEKLLNGYSYVTTGEATYSMGSEFYPYYHYNSILKPDGTLLDYMNYSSLCFMGLGGKDGTTGEHYWFPQNESGDRFILYKKVRNDIIYSSYYEDNIYDKCPVLIDNNGNVLLDNVNSMRFWGAEYVITNKGIHKSSDGSLIYERNSDIPDSSDVKFTYYISEDRSRNMIKYNYINTKDNLRHIKYVFIDNNGNIIEQGDMLEIPFNEKYLVKELCGYNAIDRYDYDVYKDSEGMLYEHLYIGSSCYDLPAIGPLEWDENNSMLLPRKLDYSIVKFGNRCEYDYLQLDSYFNIDDSLLDSSYFYKSIEVPYENSKRYYSALFKTLEPGETIEDYASKEQPSNWAEDCISKATKEELLYNNSNCFFTSPITKQDFCILAVEAYLKSQNMSIEQYVTDNNVKTYGNIYIAVARSLGIVANETVKSTVHPDSFITRQEAAVMLTNLAKLMGITSNSPKVNFIDSQYYADWAKDAIYTVSSIKNDEGIAIMTGTEPNKFSPWMYYTREQAYVTIYRLFEMCK